MSKFAKQIEIDVRADGVYARMIGETEWHGAWENAFEALQSMYRVFHV